MDRQRDEQTKLPLEVSSAPRRRRRRRRHRHTGRVPAAQRELLSRPVLQTCGFCGHRQTVFEQAGLCERCGGVLVKADPEEEW